MLILALLLGGSILVWAQIVGRRRVEHRAAVDFEPRTAVPWDGIYVAISAVAYLMLRSAIVDWTTGPFLPEDAAVASPEALLTVPGYAAALFRGVCFSDLIVLGISCGAIIAGTKASRGDLGLVCPAPSVDFRLGAAAFLAVAVPALLLQAVLQALVAESRHPIGLALKQFHDPTTIFWAVMAAVVIAPPVEEFLFRIVLQGWFERIYAPFPAVEAPIEAEPTDAAAIDVAPPAVSTTTFDSQLPVLLSSTIFALMHWSSGIDVIALFLVALGLGYLYRQTHRIGPGIVMHMLLNAFSMAMLLLGANA